MLGFVKAQERYEIQWLDLPKGVTNMKKMVSRANLRFEGENERVFLQMLEDAETYKALSEIFLKYNFMIDAINSSSNTLPNDQKERIILFTTGKCFQEKGWRDPIAFMNTPPNIRYNCKLYLLPQPIDAPKGKDSNAFLQGKGYNRDLVLALVKEVEKDFIRANHIVEF